jgi:hypothetical protein
MGCKGRGAPFQPGAGCLPRRFATRPLGIVSFSLTPQGRRRRIPATFPAHFETTHRKRQSSIQGGTACSTCRDGPCSASTRSARPAATGCAPRSPARNSAATVARHCTTYRRRWAPACGCAPAHSGVTARPEVRGSRPSRATRVCSPPRQVAIRAAGARPRRCHIPLVLRSRSTPTNTWNTPKGEPFGSQPRTIKGFLAAELFSKSPSLGLRSVQFERLWSSTRVRVPPRRLCNGLFPQAVKRRPTRPRGPIWAFSDGPMNCQCFLDNGPVVK